MPLAFQVSTLTTRPPTPPLPWHTKMKGQVELKAEHKAPITEDCYLPSKLLDGTDCMILLGTGAGKSSRSKTYTLTVHYYIHYLSLCQRNRIFQ